MKREELFAALNDLDDRYITEARCYTPRHADSAPERIVHMNKKRIITFALAAALLLMLGVTAYAVNAAVSSPQTAEKVAREQIEVWKEMGILNPAVSFEGEASQIVEIEEHQGSDYWYGRLFHHAYDVRWYFSREGAKYGCNLRVDTMTGKILTAFIDAVADAEDVPVREEESTSNTDENGNPRLLRFYDNFDDIVPADMTVGRFCGLLAEYWGFTGYTIADTVDEQYYHKTWEAVADETLLKDLSGDTTGNYYLTVFFEGDQEGAPMYIQLQQFPGYVDLAVGTYHAIG